MTWPATERFHLRSAPGGLGLVQDFLMTGDSAGRLRAWGPDLLDSMEAAQAWITTVSRSWETSTGKSAPSFELTANDLRHLRKLRSALFEYVSSRSHGVPPNPQFAVTYRADSHVTSGPDGMVRLTAKGRGWKLVLSWLLLEIEQAQREKTWERIKACKNTRCGGVFYDSSRNNSGAWHDVRTCGNVANLRASRARRMASR